MSMDIPQPPEQPSAIEALQERVHTTLQRGVEIFTGNSEGDPLEVFPSAGAVRADAPEPELTPQQAKALRATAAEFGFGREADRTASELGLSNGYVAVIDGGQIHKVLAEIQIALLDDVKPGSFVIIAREDRPISSEDQSEAMQKEVASIRLQLGLEDDEPVEGTEYSITDQALDAIVPFVREDPEELALVPLGEDDHIPLPHATVGLTTIGRILNLPVVMLKFDRDSYVGDDGKRKDRKEHDNAASLVVVSKALSVVGDEHTELGFITSASYQTSREIDAARAADITGRTIAVPSYGAARLASVKMEAIPAAVPLNQVPGEFHRVARQMKKLEAQTQADA